MPSVTGGERDVGSLPSARCNRGQGRCRYRWAVGQLDQMPRAQQLWLFVRL